MYRKQISPKASPSVRSMPKSKEITPSPSYGSLSSVVQRVQDDPNSVSEDERQQLESAIGSRSTGEILIGKQTSWVPQFQGISAQLWGDAGQVSTPIQAKGKDRIGVSEVKPENKTGLPDNLKAGIENLSGMAMDDVRVHYNSPKPAQLKALAYTQGMEIHVAPGQEKHLPHEAWHVVQQMQGRVKPTMQMKGVQINDNEGLEKEADVMCEKSSQLTKRETKQFCSYLEPTQKIFKGHPTVQLLEGEDAVPIFALGDKLTSSNDKLREFWLLYVHRDIMKNFKNVKHAREALEKWSQTIKLPEGEAQWKRVWDEISRVYPKMSIADKFAKEAGNELNPNAPLPSNVMHSIGSFLDDRSLARMEMVSRTMKEWALDEQLGDHHPAGDWGPSGKKTQITAEHHRQIAHMAYRKAKQTPEVLLYRVSDKKKAKLSSVDAQKSVSSVAPEYPWGKTPAWIQGAVRRRATFRLLSDPAAPGKLIGGENLSADEDAVLTRELRQIVLEFGYTINGPDLQGWFTLIPPEKVPDRLRDHMDWSDTWNPSRKRVGSLGDKNDRTAVIERFIRRRLCIENLANSKYVQGEDLDKMAEKVGVHIFRSKFSDGTIENTQKCEVEVQNDDEASLLIQNWNEKMIETLSAPELKLRVYAPF